MKKRILAILLLAALSVSLVACSNDKDKNKEGTSTSVEKTTFKDIFEQGCTISKCETITIDDEKVYRVYITGEIPEDVKKELDSLTKKTISKIRKTYDIDISGTYKVNDKDLFIAKIKDITFTLEFKKDVETILEKYESFPDFEQLDEVQDLKVSKIENARFYAFVELDAESAQLINELDGITINEELMNNPEKYSTKENFEIKLK